MPKVESEHPEAEIDRDYRQAYQKQPIDTRDEWGDVTSFLDAAAKLKS